MLQLQHLFLSANLHISDSSLVFNCVTVISSKKNLFQELSSSRQRRHGCRARQDVTTWGSSQNKTISSQSPAGALNNAGDSEVLFKTSSGGKWTQQKSIKSNKHIEYSSIRTVWRKWQAVWARESCTQGNLTSGLHTPLISRCWGARGKRRGLWVF